MKQLYRMTPAELSALHSAAMKSNTTEVYVLAMDVAQNVVDTIKGQLEFTPAQAEVYASTLGLELDRLKVTSRARKWFASRLVTI